MIMANDDGSILDFGFGFNNINFSDRVLRIEIEVEDLRPKNRTKKGNKLCNIDSGIEVKNMHINSIILAAKSPFFFKLFSNGMKESEERHATLRIDSSEEVAFMDLLNFMYTNTLSSSTTSSLMDVLMLADKFQVSSCMRHCNQLLSKLTMTCESALEYSHLPSTVLMADEVQPLVEAAKKYLVDLYKDFAKFEDELLKLPLDIIEVVLSSDDLEVTSEDVVYAFVLKWARKHYRIMKKRQDILTTRLGSLIRFKYMTCQTLKEILACNDFEPSFASEVVLEALFFKAQSPHLHTIPGFVERAYKNRPVKVLESKFPHPHCVVYLDLKKEKCKNLLPSNRVFSEEFHLGGKTCYLSANRCTIDNNGVPSDCFGLFVGMRLKESDSCSVAFEFSVRSKPTEDFLHLMRKVTHTFTAGDNRYGYDNILKVSWSQFIADDSVYFINGVLYLKVEIRMNP